jgi:FkbM family methyltransferase
MGLGIKTQLNALRHYVCKYKVPILRYCIWGDTTQHGEYLVLRHLVTPDFPKLIVDVGANDGFLASNSYPFITRGWQAILIEPHPGVFRRLETRYKDNPNVTTVNLACADVAGRLPLFMGKEEHTGSYSTLSTEDSAWFRQTRTDRFVEVNVERLNTILTQNQCPQDIGILSVDTEGFDYAVLAGLDFCQFRPRIIITEDEKADQQEVARRKEALLTSQGYQFRRRLENNAIWAGRLQV